MQARVLAPFSCSGCAHTGSHGLCELTPAFTSVSSRRISWGCRCSAWNSFSQRRHYSESSRSRSSSEHRTVG